MSTKKTEVTPPADELQAATIPPCRREHFRLRNLPEDLHSCRGIPPTVKDAPLNLIQ